MNLLGKICICLLATLFLSVSFTGIAAHADDLADAMKKHDYPWYNAEADQLKPLESKTEAFPMSADREAIEVGKVKVPNPKKPPAPTGGGAAAPAAGTGWFSGFDISSLFMTILVVLILAALVFLFFKFLAVESSDEDSGAARRKKLLSESIEQLPFDLQVGNGDFRSMAQQAYQAGDLRRAIIYLYSHVLVSLDQNERISLRKGKTNRQYLKEVWEDPKLSTYFKSVMLPFESAFFGDHDPEPDQFERCWSGLETFHSHLGQPEGGGA